MGIAREGLHIPVEDGAHFMARQGPRSVESRIETFARAFEDCAMLRGASQYSNLMRA